ncbi:ComEA family DNA-binding protein [Atopobium fossor]|uniref:ComEA family DNA-binding protein n=1 Tax=Atopobium fossor TaxID=39487 RepID=UPI0003F85070|nr:ComEA family DNA-binding protein [Atopobium fossor]
MAQIQSNAFIRRLSVLKRTYSLTKPKLLALGVSAALFIGGLVFVAFHLPIGGIVIGQSDTQDAQSIEKSSLKNMAEKSDGKSDTKTQNPTTQMQASGTAQFIVVHVDGAVAKPGVYTLEQPKPRIKDAVDLAGGLGEEADTSTINLAAIIEDGSKIYIPKQGESIPLEQAVSDDTQSNSNRTLGTHADAGDTHASGLININTATEQELMSLPGVGKSTAQAIIEDRRINGVFATVEDLMRVSGIGAKKFEKLQGKIRV